MVHMYKNTTQNQYLCHYIYLLKMAVWSVEDALSKDSVALDLKCMLHGSLSATEYIHSKTIFHDDIKGSNIVHQ